MPRTQENITKADAEAGKRMRALRERWGVSQERLLPKNRTQVSTVETGANLLRGVQLLQEYADAFGVQPKDITAYREGKLTIEEFIKLSSNPPSSNAAPPKRGRKPALARGQKVEAQPVAAGITKDMMDRVAIRLAKRPEWDLSRALMAVHMVHGLHSPSDDALYNAAVVADLDAQAGGEAFPRASDVEPKSSAKSSIPPKVEAAIAGELGQARKKQLRLPRRQAGK